MLVDVNIPINSSASGAFPPWIENVSAELRSIEMDDKLEPAFVFFANYPYHFVQADQAAPESHVTLQVLKRPEFSPDFRAGLRQHPIVRCSGHSATIAEFRPTSLNDASV